MIETGPKVMFFLSWYLIHSCVPDPSTVSGRNTCWTYVHRGRKKKAKDGGRLGGEGGHLFQRHTCTVIPGWKWKSGSSSRNWWYFSEREELMGLWGLLLWAVCCNSTKGKPVTKGPTTEPIRICSPSHGRLTRPYRSGVRYGEHRSIAGLRTIIPLGHSPIYCIVYYS